MFLHLRYPRSGVGLALGYVCPSRSLGMRSYGADCPEKCNGITQEEVDYLASDMVCPIFSLPFPSWSMRKSFN